MEGIPFEYGEVDGAEPSGVVSLFDRGRGVDARPYFFKKFVEVIVGVAALSADESVAGQGSLGGLQVSAIVCTNGSRNGICNDQLASR